MHKGTEKFLISQAPKNRHKMQKFNKSHAFPKKIIKVHNETKTHSYNYLVHKNYHYLKIMHTNPH